MSVQEENLRAIADAIREKEGTEGPIPAKEFAERIRGIQSGLVGKVISESQIARDWLNFFIAIPPEFSNIILSGIAFGNGIFVIAATCHKGNSTGSLYDYDVLLSGIDGINFGNVFIGASNTWKITSVIYGNGQFVAIASGCAYLSNDGINWERVSASHYCNFLAYGKGKFVGAGSNSYIACSENGRAWDVKQVRPSGYTESYLMITYANEKFIALDKAGYLAYSQDGIEWQYEKLPSTDYKFLAYGNGKFVAVGGNSKIAYSTNLAEWIEISSPVQTNWYRVVVECGSFILFGENNNVAMSLDLETWNTFTPTLNGKLLDLISVDNILHGLFTTYTGLSFDGEIIAL